jgi:4-carboxymuconolactone decarboxylase
MQKACATNGRDFTRDSRTKFAHVRASLPHCEAAVAARHADDDRCRDRAIALRRAPTRPLPTMLMMCPLRKTAAHDAATVTEPGATRSITMSDRRDETIEQLFDRGLEVRREVLGPQYVDGSLRSANDFMMAFQRITTEWCWGYAWTREGLDRKTRSLLNLAMLTALNRAPEIKLHVRGAINNGVTADEIKETLLHATVYCGIPAGLDAFKAANEVLKEMGALD